MQFLTITLVLLAPLLALAQYPHPIPHHSLLMLTRQAIPISCAFYAQTANYTAINSNSSIRAAFLQASPDGTDPTRAIIDTAAKEFVNRNMMFDEALNKECGNLSAIAMEEVGKNFSNGIVGPFKIKLTANTAGRVEMGSLGLVTGLVVGLGMLL